LVSATTPLINRQGLICRVIANLTPQHALPLDFSRTAEKNRAVLQQRIRAISA
jgi:hypothetical protein